MEIIRFILSALCIAIGLAACIIGVLGTFKFKFILNRMHSAAMLDTCGLLFIIIGLCIYRGFDSATIKLCFIFIFLWLTSPVSSHLIAKVEYETDESVVDEIENPLDEIKGDDSDEY